MYQEFYQLPAEPFRLSPDHRFCYDHKGYAKARAYMAYAFSQAEGLVMITGRPGTGKTTLIGELVESLAGDNVTTANLVCNQLQADDLLKMVAYSFGVGHNASSKSELLQQLDALLRKWHRQDHRALLIVDEAQDLSPCAMEELRLLGNIQSSGKPLLQIFLLGQPELRDLVHSPALEQVHQRIVAASHLEPLKLDETEAYIRHRLETVGWTGDPAFSKPLFPLIHKFSEGVPRKINLICSRLFLHGSVEQKHALGVQDLRAVIEELKAEQLAIGSFISHEDFAVEDEFEEFSPPQPEHDTPENEIATPAIPTEQERAANEYIEATPQQPQEIARVAESPAPVINIARERVAEVATASPVAASGPAARVHQTAASTPRRDRGRQWFALAMTFALVLVVAGGLVYAPAHIIPDSWRDKVAAVRQALPAIGELAEPDVGPAVSRPREDEFSALSVTPDSQAEHSGIAEAAVTDKPLDTTVEEPGFQQPLAPTRQQQSPGSKITAASAVVTTEYPTDPAADTAVTMEPPTITSQQSAVTPGETVAAIREPAVTPEDPMLTTQEPQVSRQELSVTAPEQAASPQEPILTVQEPQLSQQQPTVTALEPPVAAPQPALGQTPVPPATASEQRFIVVEFGFDSARLSAQARRRLDEVAASAAANSQQINIAGYADSRGDPDYNQRLSSKRAAAVAAYLAERGIPVERLVVEGRGIYDEGNALELQREQVASIASQRFVQVVFEQQVSSR